jgi:hypothetical protein
LKWHDDWIAKNEQLLGEALAAAPNVRVSNLSTTSSGLHFSCSATKPSLPEKAPPASISARV